MDHIPAPVTDLSSWRADLTAPAADGGATLAVYLPPGTPLRVMELLHEQVAGLLSRTRRGFGPQVVWREGNPLDLPD